MIPSGRSPRSRQVASLFVSPTVDLDELNGAFWAADAQGVLPYALAPVARSRSRLALITHRTARHVIASPSGVGFHRTGEYRS
ncbi:MAG: hypothetical protein ACYCST_11160 [Acidimicrobiales bacterium]